MEKNRIKVLGALTELMDGPYPSKTNYDLLTSGNRNILAEFNVQTSSW